MNMIYHLVIFFILTYFTYFVESTISCSFDSGLCGWHGVGNSSFQWRTYSGPSPDRSSGPLNDHTCNNYKGQYAFITGDDVQTRGEVAVLESEELVIDESKDFGFWYLMNGIGLGNLSLEIMSPDAKKNIVWTTFGRHGRNWQHHSVKLEPGNFTLRFGATVRLPYGSDLAIDDVTLTSEDYSMDTSHCKLPPTTTVSTKTSTTAITNEETTSHTTVLAPVHSTGSPLPKTCASLPPNVTLLPGSCKFEKDTCGLKIIPSRGNADTKWERTSQTYGFLENQIAGDHNGKGYYMHFVIGHGFFFSNPNYTARLETPDITSMNACLTFWYNMPGRYSNLRVYVTGHGNQSQQVWAKNTRNEGASQGWKEGSVTIQQEPPYRITFATTNDHGLAHVGIDDISILGTPTVVSTTNSVPVTTKANMSTTTQSDTPTTIPTTVTTNIETSGPIRTDNPISRKPITTNALVTSSSVNTTSILTSTSETNSPIMSSIASVSKKPKPIDHHKSVSDRNKADNSKLATAVGASVGGMAGLLLLTMLIIYAYLRLRAKPMDDKVGFKSSPINRQHSWLTDNELTVISNGKPHIHGHNNSISQTKQEKKENLSNGHMTNGTAALNGLHISQTNTYDISTHF